MPLMYWITLFSSSCYTLTLFLPDRIFPLFSYISSLFPHSLCSLLLLCFPYHTHYLPFSRLLPNTHSLSPLSIIHCQLQTYLTLPPCYLFTRLWKSEVCNVFQTKLYSNSIQHIPCIVKMSILIHTFSPSAMRVLRVILTCSHIDLALVKAVNCIYVNVSCNFTASELL